MSFSGAIPTAVAVDDRFMPRTVEPESLAERVKRHMMEEASKPRPGPIEAPECAAYRRQVEDAESDGRFHDEDILWARIHLRRFGGEWPEERDLREDYFTAEARMSEAAVKLRAKLRERELQVAALLQSRGLDR